MTWQLQRKDVLDGDQLRALLTGHPGRAAQAIVSAAAENIADAQALLGQILLDGTGIARDPGLALRWFEIAARNGHVMALNMLGRCHEHGWGCRPDVALAADYYRRAASAGLDWGLYNLGNLLATGRGVPRDPVRALDCYRQAAGMGHAKSMNLLGRYLEDGVFCHKDLPAAYEWYRCSAEGGDFRGQFSHAAVLADHGRIDEAVVWLRLALQNGNLNFLRVSRAALLQSDHVEIRALAKDFHQRAMQLGDDHDRAAFEVIYA
jgi:TPR repeat protein